MSDQIADKSDAPPQHPIDRALEKLPRPVRKLGHDLTISAFFNACAFVAHTLPALVGGNNTLGGIFAKSAESLGVGTVVLAAGIAAGRYIGGAAGMAVDALAHRDDGKFRKIFATAGGTIMGTAAFAAYEVGALAGVAPVLKPAA